MTAPPPLRRLPTQVGALAFTDEGAGTPLLLWPSLFSDHRLFAHLLPALGPGWRTIRVDGPGFGQSDPPAPDVPPQTYADAAVQLLDALGIETAIVAGCSWGGQIAVHLAVRAPHRVRGVLTMNTPLGPSRGGHAFEVLGTRWFGSRPFWGAGVARSMFSPQSQAAHPDRVRAFTDAFRHFDPAAAATTARTVLTRFPGLGDALALLTVPTTLLFGAEDRLYPVARLRPYAARAPGARVEIVPGCGHLAPLEAPEAVAAALEGLRADAGWTAAPRSAASRAG